VDLVYPQADSQSLSFLVRVRLLDADVGVQNDSGELKPGMFARVQVTLGPPRRVTAVPELAIINKKNNEGMVFVIDGNVLAGRKVSIGPALGESQVHGGEREITAGLSAGELVVLRPEADLREGTHVAIDK
jgi:membrane fusion protein (multidrug efflux system)